MTVAALAVPALLTLLAAAKPAPPPPPALDVRAEGTMVTGSVSGERVDRFRLTAPPEKGTIIVALDRVQGQQAKGVLRNDAGLVVRRTDKRGMLWARPAAGSELVLEVKAPAKDAGCTYLLSVAFDVDRPKEQRGERRPARPRDVVKITTAGLDELAGVRVGGVVADYSINGASVLVTIPAYARSGPIELRFEQRAPVVEDVTIIGAEPPRADVITGACAPVDGAAPPGCLDVVIAPSVGTLWLTTIAKVVDADVAKHVVATGAVQLKLHLPATETYALELLASMPGVIAAQRSRAR